MAEVGVKRNKKLVFPVVNDLNYDQRMQRICSALARAGYDVTLIGREMKGSIPLKERIFKQIRFNHKVHSGKLFYLIHNWKLLLHYLKNDYDVFIANDLDTMFAGYVASVLKGKPLVYDAHEYFAELPEVVHRPLVKFVWKSLERWTVPRATKNYTINLSYAKFFKDAYQEEFDIIRNATVLEDKNFPEKPDDYILYQGAVNVGRGVEEMIKAMPYINSKLVICGKGDVFEDCVQLVEDLGIEDKVEFKGFVEPEKLKEITIRAKLGFTFFTNDGESYYYSLANRFFDYFHNGVPQLCINFPEYKAINDQHDIAIMLDDLETETIVNAVNELFADGKRYNELRANCLKTREVINWQNEEKKLLKIYDSI